jgi:hypothetical protein
MITRRTGLWGWAQREIVGLRYSGWAVRPRRPVLETAPSTAVADVLAPYNIFTNSSRCGASREVRRRFGTRVQRGDLGGSELVVVVRNAIGFYSPLTAAEGARRRIRDRTTEIRVRMVIIVDNPRCAVHTGVIDGRKRGVHSTEQRCNDKQHLILHLVQ